MEVFPSNIIVILSEVNLLHARGGVSAYMTPSDFLKKSSPRTWRCFLNMEEVIISVFIFSTHVEVFLKKDTKRDTKSNLLHARGGVSAQGNQVNLTNVIFSTHVEVFL